MLPDAGIPFCRMPPDVSPTPCRMPPDATNVKMSGTSEQVLAWRPILQPRHTGSPQNREGGGCGARKSTRGRKTFLRTGQYNAHFVCRMLPDAGIPFCRMLPDVSPRPCRMPPDAKKNFAGCQWKVCTGPQPTMTFEKWSVKTTTICGQRRQGPLAVTCGQQRSARLRSLVTRELWLLVCLSVSPTHGTSLAHCVFCGGSRTMRW